jgi:DNA-binding transcriptional LysR family regulator
MLRGTLTQARGVRARRWLSSVKAGTTCGERTCRLGALAALRQHLGDPLVTRGAGGMALTPGGQRLVRIASQMISLAAEAESAIREATGAPERLRVVATSTAAEFAVPPLLEVFTSARAGAVEATVASRHR